MASGEGLAGTAAEAVKTWALVEVRTPWGVKVPRDAGLQPQVSATFERWAEQLPGLRLQFIRRPARKEGAHALFLAQPEQGRFVHVDLECLEAVSNVEVEELLADGSARLERPHYFVCTHGTRDRCCAKFGMPVFERLNAIVGERVWQTSHLGGHRFAATLLALPEALCFGRVELDELEAMVRSVDEGRPGALAQRWRGRCALPRPVQALECAARCRSVVAQGAALESWSLDVLDEGSWQARVTIGGQVLGAQVRRVEGEGQAPGGCGDAPRAVQHLKVLGLGRS